MQTYEFNLNKQIDKLNRHISSRVEFKGGVSEGYISLIGILQKLKENVPGCNKDKERRLILERQLICVRQMILSTK